MGQKEVVIRIKDYRPAYYFRKDVREQGSKQHMQRLKKVSNKSLMYAITFFNRKN